MRFIESALPGAYVVEPERRADARGFFARTWCAREFAEHGLEANVVQCSVSFNERAGTLRGMHYQAIPHEEVKLVRCTRGSVLDVILDLRPHSPTFRRWVGVELSAENGFALYVPRGVAHGFQTLVEHTEVFYQMSQEYRPEAARGVRWDDAAFGIEWPLANPVLSERDRTLPDFVAP